MGKITYQTLRERVSEAIRTKIRKNEYQPGDRIVEQELAAEFGVSRGPFGRHSGSWKMKVLFVIPEMSDVQ